MITDKFYYRKVSKRLITFILTLFIIYIFLRLSVFYIPFLIALIISLIIEPLIRWVMKITQFTRKTSAVIILTFTFSLIIALLIWGIIGVITEAENILNNLNDNVRDMTELISNLTDALDLNNLKIPENIRKLILECTDRVIEEGNDILKKILINILESVKNLPRILICVGITILATYFTCTDRMYILDQIEHHLPRNWVNKVGSKMRKIIESLGSYLKAQSILILITFIIILIGLFTFKYLNLTIEYPLLMAILISFVDALPIVGSGTVIIPWAVISAFDGDIKLAIMLIILYIIVIVTRQLIEPKIVSNHIGIHPIFTLISMYTGFKTIGIVGMFVGPIILIILKDVFETMIDKGVVKTILDRK